MTNNTPKEMDKKKKWTVQKIKKLMNDGQEDWATHILSNFANNQTVDTPKETWAERLNDLIILAEQIAAGLAKYGGDFPHPRKQIIFLFRQALAQAKAAGAWEVIGEIQYRLDGAKQDVEMAEDPADPKVRINYFESVLATLREDYKEEPCSKPTESSKSS